MDSREKATASPTTTGRTVVTATPPKINFNLWREKKWNIVRYWTLIMFCNLALPCIIYYPIRSYTSLSLQDAIGAGSASLGVSACIEFPIRLWKLWYRRERYGPLNDETRWHLDSFMWSYTFAMLLAAIPLAVAPATNPPLVTFFLMTTGILIGSMGVNMIPTLFSFKTLTWASSDPPGTRIKPGVFYTVEDVCAVDCGKGREFRREWNARYDASPIFRRLMYQLTVFWIVGSLVYVGITAAVTFTAPLDVAYVVTLSMLYVWGAVWWLITWEWCRFTLKREREWFAEHGGKELN